MSHLDRAPGQATAGPSASVMIWQNFHQPAQRAGLDPAFIPLDGTRNPRTSYRELALFARAYHAGRHQLAEYSGIVSAKFGAKTGISGAMFIDFIATHPGADVYFINPFPQNAYFSFNVWEHAELCHPGLTALAQKLLWRAGSDICLATLGRNAADTLLYANYWVGNRRFWDRFMDLSLRLLAAFEAMEAAERGPYLALDPHYPDPVPKLPFLFERIFSTLLLTDRSLRARAWPQSRATALRAAQGPEEYRLVRAFGEIIDEIDRVGAYDARERALFAALGALNHPPRR